MSAIPLHFLPVWDGGKKLANIPKWCALLRIYFGTLLPLALGTAVDSERDNLFKNYNEFMTVNSSGRTKHVRAKGDV